tara:strand:- start:4450 stop:6054 length:1605 start_codon:yes stop_codon:yes gene_type:complete
MTQIDRLDGLSSSTAIKGPCRVATTEDITLTDLQTIDGVALADGDRVLVRAQMDAKQNGIYVVDTGEWRRSRDFASNRDIRKGTRVVVTSGITYATSEWLVTASDPIVLGTSEIGFAQLFFSSGSDVTINAPGWITVQTLALLNTITPANETFGASVLDDPTASNNGFYYRQALNWVKGRGFPDTLARLTKTGGTVNAVEVSASNGVDPAQVVAFYHDVAPGDENTGDVTIEIDGGPALPVYQYDGTQFPAGAFAGRLFLTNEGSSLKSLDPNTTFVQQLAAIATQLEAVGDNIAAILAVNANEADIDAVAADIANVNTVAANITNVAAAGANGANISAVAANEVNINAAVAGLPDLAEKMNKSGSNTLPSAFWNICPVGFEYWRDEFGDEPPNDGSVGTWVKLTYGDAYNDGVLINETISGSAPNITSSAEVNVAGPYLGETITLLNSTGHFLRPGESAGTQQNSANLSHSHTGSTGGASAAFLRPGGSTYVVNGGSSWQTTDHSHSLNINNSGGTEARPRNESRIIYKKVAA